MRKLADDLSKQTFGAGYVQGPNKTIGVFFKPQKV